LFLGWWKRRQMWLKMGEQHSTWSLLCTWMLPSRSHCCSCKQQNFNSEVVSSVGESARCVGSFGCI
jgi:hypothetical protein